MENKGMWQKGINNNKNMFLKLYIHDIKEKMLLIFGTTMLCLFLTSVTIVQDCIDYADIETSRMKINDDTLWMYGLSVFLSMIGLMQIKKIYEINKRKKGDNEYTKINVLRITSVITGVVFTVVTGALIASMINLIRQDHTANMINRWDPSSYEGITYAFWVAAILSFTTLKDLGYLHEKRKSDLYESMPISKRGLLFEKIMIGYSKTIIPFILSIIAPVIFCISNGLNWDEIWKFGAFTCIYMLFNIAFGSLICVCCGRKMESVITYIVINLLLIGFVSVIAIVGEITPGHLFLFDTEYVMQCLLPLATLLQQIDGVKHSNVLEGENLLIIIMLALTVVLFAIQFYIIKYRKSESAEDKCGFKQMYTVIKYLAAVIAGTVAGLFLAYVKESSNLVVQMIVFWLASVISVILAYISLHIIYHREIKNIKVEIKGIAVSLITIAVLMFTAQTGLFGMDEYQPSIDDIEYVLIRVDKSNGLDYEDAIKLSYSKENKQKILNIHKAVIKDYIDAKEFGLNKIYSEKSNDYYNACELRYKLKNGKVVKRFYDGYVLSEEMLEQVKNISIADGFKALKLDDENIKQINIDTSQYYYDLLISDECLNDIKAFRDVYIKELEEIAVNDGRRVEEIMDFDNPNEERIEINFTIPRTEDEYLYAYYIDQTIPVTKDMKESYRMIKNIIAKYYNPAFLE